MSVRLVDRWRFGCAVFCALALACADGVTAEPNSTPGLSAAQSSETAADLDKTINHLLEAGRYAEAIPLAERSLAIRESELGPNHPDVAVSLHLLGRARMEAAVYAQAKPVFERALAIREAALGPRHPDV